MLLFSCFCFSGLSVAQPVRVHLKWSHQFQFAGYYAALEHGFYAAEGLQVELVEGGDSHNPVQELMAGRVQYAVVDSGVLLDRAEGMPVVVLANIFQHSPQVIICRNSGDDAFIGPESLRRKRVMMQSGYQTVEVMAVLKKFGITGADFIRQPASQDVSDLIRGKTDAFPAYSTNEPFLLNQQGVPYTLFRPHDYGIDFYGDMLVTSEQELSSHRERAEAFRRATIKGWIYALHHIDETVALIREKYNSQNKSAAHLKFEAQAIRDLVFPDVVPVGTSSIARWQHIADTFSSLGYRTEAVDLDEFIYQPAPDIAQIIHHYRFWMGFGVLALMVLLLYIYNVQLRYGIKRRTQKIEAMSSEYQDILDHMQDAYYRSNLDGELTWVSLACERQLGYGRDELIGQPISMLYYDESGRQQFIEALEASGGNLQHYEVCLKHKDGSRVWAEVNSQYDYNDLGEVVGVEGNVRNINERKRAERESRELTDQLQQAQKMESIGVLAGGIAHDFNNLLVGVMGNAELAMLDTPEQGEMRQYLEQIFKSARRGADLVRQMLAYSGQGRFTMGEQNFNDLICDVSELLSTVIGKHVKLDQQLMDNLPDVHGDKNQLTQLIMNLMTNASEAMHGKPGEIYMRTGVRHLNRDDFSGMYMASDLEEGDFVFMQVEDSGCGMDEQTTARIFDPFFTTKETGSGLGLAALLGIVHSHGGTLSLSSEPGRGSCFTVYLPVLESENAEDEVHSNEAEVSPELHGAVLVVDDEESVRDVARRLLEREGIQVLTADDGAEAIEVFRKHADNIALVLMDLTMPEMDGEQAFHSIRAIRPDATIVLSSGFSESEAAERLRPYGLAGFIRKPYTRKVLLYEVARLGIAEIDGLGLDS